MIDIIIYHMISLQSMTCVHATSSDPTAPWEINTSCNTTYYSHVQYRRHYSIAAFSTYAAHRHKQARLSMLALGERALCSWFGLIIATYTVWRRVHMCI